MSETLKNLLVEAARELLREGAEKLDLRQVARAAGKSRTAPYVAFGPTEDGGGLEALRVAVAASGFQDLADRLGEAVGQAGEGSAALARVGEEYFAFADGNPGLFRVMFGPEVARAIKRRDGTAPRSEVRDLLEARRRAQREIEVAIQSEQERGAEIGSSTAMATQRAALAAWAMFHGAAMLLLDGQFELQGLDSEAVNGMVLPFLLERPVAGLLEAAEDLSEAKKQKEAVVVSREPSPASTEPLAAPSTLRRLRRNVGTVEGSTILWVDDMPELSQYEERAMTRLGATVVRARSTEEALVLKGEQDVDLIISDIARPGSDRAGLDDLPILREAFPEAPVVFYVGGVDRSLGTPSGSFGITSSPEELLHLALDVLERRRS